MKPNAFVLHTDLSTVRIVPLLPGSSASSVRWFYQVDRLDIGSVAHELPQQAARALVQELRQLADAIAAWAVDAEEVSMR